MRRSDDCRRRLAITGVGTVQVAVVCVWRLVTMSARETVFSDRAFRVVDVLIGAACLAAVLALDIEATDLRAAPGAVT